MGLAEELASKVKGKADKPKSKETDEAEAVKPGDRGKAILAAIKSGDGEALEELLKD